MGQETITVDKKELEHQIAALEQLCRDTSLSGAVKEVQTMIRESTGDLVENTKELNPYLEGISTQLSILFSRTLEFLKNAKESYIQVDEGLANKIRDSK